MAVFQALRPENEREQWERITKKRQVSLVLFVLTLTHLAARAAHSHAVLVRGLDGGGGAGAHVLGEAEVVVGAHVDDVLHHFARVSDNKKQ